MQQKKLQPTWLCKKTAWKLLDFWKRRLCAVQLYQSRLILKLNQGTLSSDDYLMLLRGLDRAGILQMFGMHVRPLTMSAHQYAHYLLHLHLLKPECEFCSTLCMEGVMKVQRAYILCIVPSISFCQGDTICLYFSNRRKCVGLLRVQSSMEAKKVFDCANAD